MVLTLCWLTARVGHGHNANVFFQLALADEIVAQLGDSEEVLAGARSLVAA